MTICKRRIPALKFQVFFGKFLVNGITAQPGPGMVPALGQYRFLIHTALGMIYCFDIYRFYIAKAAELALFMIVITMTITIALRKTSIAHNIISRNRIDTMHRERQTGGPF
ncbi:hypothetical protein D9M68_672990 [compost metagenome]